MHDLQERLRDAIAASVDGAEPSFDLMTAVRRRHRQRLRRLAAAGAAAVMVVTATTALLAARQAHGRVEGLLGPATSHPPPVDRRVHHDPAYIGLRRAVPEQLPPAPVGPLERDLEHVLSSSLVPAGQHQSQPEQLR